MTQYEPSYPCVVQERTTVEKVNTMHTESFDWQYPFEAVIRERASRSFTDSAAIDARVAQDLEMRIGFLKLIESNAGNAQVSNYGGWPRIWHDVIGFGMASCWPYWTPRPTVVMETCLGCEWVDWDSLTGAQVKEQPR